jgi:diguanylate cyclase (GGDEF)-like protein/PAS domain S-box-containing protein
VTTVAAEQGRFDALRQDVSSRLSTLPVQLEAYIVPDDVLATGEFDPRTKRKRSLRIVSLISVSSVVLFMFALFIARVPAELWLPFTATVVLAVCVISWSLLVVRPGSRLVPVAVVADALIIATLGWVLGDYYHQMALLYALVVAGHTAIHGFRAGLIMALCGSILVPLAITASLGLNATDVLYALIYLLGVATIPWLYIRLRGRGVEALRHSATKYRNLVEHVPAIVYTARSGPFGVCEYISPRAEEVLGFPTEAWTDDPGFWLSRVHPDDRERMIAYWQDGIRRRDPRSDAVEYRMIDAAGEARWLRDEASVLDPDEEPAQRWTGFLTDITDRKALEEELQYQAFHDPLTGLPNRALFADRLGHALPRADRRRESVAVLFLDLDDFKTVNDGIGHEAGDELLVAVAQILQASVRPMDTAARLGGDEFAILLEDLADVHAAEAAADRILAALETPITIADREVVIGASIGIAGQTDKSDTVADIMRNADAAMYSAKRRGKGRHETFAPRMQEAVAERLELAEHMRKGLERGEFVVHYQPVVRLSDAAVTGFEALVRWHHPRRGLVMPGEFIAEAEDNGQIIAIGRVVLEEACRTARRWHDSWTDGPAPTMSVNVSARQFRDPALCDMVADTLAESGLDPASLILEITETTIMEDSEMTRERLVGLKALGVRLAIDDFGTGYSSLSYLRQLPVDVLKVDKTFVDGIVAGGQAFALARVIVSIGQTLDLDTVAEGVELSSQALALREMGCEIAQGFHFAKPMAAADVADLLAEPHCVPPEPLALRATA